MPQPLVSVFLPTHSRLQGGHLRRAIESVLRQNYGHFELLIADDGSVDGSKDLIADYANKDRRIKHIRFGQNIGLPAYTLGMAYLQSHGEYLAFVFDDCVLRPNHLAALVHKMNVEKPNGIGMVYGQALVHLAEGSSQALGRPFDAKTMAAGHNHIPNVCVMIRRQVIEDVGWYDPHVIMKRACDWDLWTRIGSKYKTGFIQEVLAEEFGPRMSDSLGNTNTRFPGILRKYQAISRDHLLHPRKFAQYDPFNMDIVRHFTSAEQAEVRYLILEHLVGTMKIRELPA